MLIKKSDIAKDGLLSLASLIGLIVLLFMDDTIANLKGMILFATIHIASEIKYLLGKATEIKEKDGKDI